MIMKFLPIFLLSFCFFSTSIFAQLNDQAITGEWTTEKGKVIKIVKQDQLFEGSTLDGASILKDLSFEGGEWKGTIQNRSGEMSAKCIIVMEDEDTIKITAHKGIFSKRFHWTRKK